MSAKKAPPAAEGEQEEEPKKKSPKMLIIIVVAVVLLGGGGFFGYTKFMKKGEHTEEEAAHKAPPVEVAVMHDWDSFLVNLADPGGKRYLKVAVKLELNSYEAETEFGSMDVQLRDAMIALLSSKEYDDIATPEGKQSLKAEIITTLNGLLKQGKVKDVYFTDFLVQ
ncbi:MAG: flagellar basal body-associated protein FliL [Syntrophobacteraceae bacterium]